MNNVLVKTFSGIGDNIYTLPFVKILAQTNQVYIQSPLPDIYKDVPNIKFVKFEDMTYRTQSKSLLNDATKYSTLPKNIYKTYTPQYGGKELLENSVIGIFYKEFGIPFQTEIEWKLPSFENELDDFLNKIPKDRRIAIIRPATIRKEWRVSSRNANPNYIAWCCRVLNEAGYYTISIADLKDGEEWLVDGIDVPAQMKLHKGELGIYGTLELFKHAKIVIAGSGFALPASVSSDTNLFLILGGRLLYDGISKTIHPSMNLNKISWAIPDLPCKCTQNEHNCTKAISTLDSDFYNFLRKVNANSK